MAVARAYNGGLGAQPPSGSRSEAPLKLKHFRFFDVQWKPQICPLFYNLETQRMSYLCKKSWVATKLGRLEQNWGLCPSPAPGSVALR